MHVFHCEFALFLVGNGDLLDCCLAVVEQVVRYVREAVLVLVFVVLAAADLLVRVYLGELFFVEHAAADCLVYDALTLCLDVHINGLGGKLRSHSRLHEHLAAFGEICVGLVALREWFDVQIVDFFSVFEFVDARRGVDLV